VIETVATLGDQPAQEQALARVEALQIRGLYVLIAGKEHKVWVEPSQSAEAAFTKDHINAIVAAVTAAFKAKQFDKGLLDAVELIRRDATGAPAAPRPAAAPLATAPKVVPRTLYRTPPPPAAAAGRERSGMSGLLV